MVEYILFNKISVSHYKVLLVNVEYVFIFHATIIFAQQSDAALSTYSMF